MAPIAPAAGLTPATTRPPTTTFLGALPALRAARRIASASASAPRSNTGARGAVVGSGRGPWVPPPRAPGFGCWRHEPAPAFFPADGAADRACRGADADDAGDSCYDLREGVASLCDCEELCLSLASCTGLEYSEWDCRELWTRGVEATAAEPGFRCLRREPAVATPRGFVDQTGATISIGGEVRLFFVGSSNTPWQT